MNGPETPGAADLTFGTITCPACGFQSREPMPDDRCVFFYECRGCHGVLRPKPGDCCVFCSYGDLPCPPKKGAGDCCGGL
jgi:hypothetical protein